VRAVPKSWFDLSSISRRQDLVRAHIVLLALRSAACAVPQADELEDESEQQVLQALETGYTACAAEWSRCAFSGTRNVRYGVGGVYAPTRSFTGGVDCRNSSFGSDPQPGVAKTCYVEDTAVTPTPTAPAPTNGSFTQCALEWQRCSFSGTRSVRYGANGVFGSPRSFTGGVDCRNDSFGGDPAPGATKSCQISSESRTPVVGAPAPSTPPVPAPTPAPSTPVTPPAPSNPISAHVPYSRANPILYSNDHPEDVHTDVIMMALQSNGKIDLRGIVTDQQSSPPSGCGGDGCHTAKEDDDKRKGWISAARQSGFQDIPDSLTGDAAVNLIVSEARAASASLPLVIIVGGPLTLVAKAYQRDPTIASKVIVAFAGFSWSSSNNKWRTETNVSNDRASAQLVLEKLRCVIVPFQDFNSKKVDETRYPSTPRSRVDQLPNEPLRARMQSIYAYPWAHYDADGGPTATLLSGSYVTASRRVRWATDTGGVYLADDNTSDDVLLTNVNGAAVTEPWWNEVKQAFAN
jgi:hypothetical protein